MNNMLHMKLVWREVKSNLGYVIETAAGMGGPLFYICRVCNCLCNDDSGHNTASAIVNEHNDALKRELRQAYRNRWQNELPETAAFYVARKGMTLADGKLDISSGELLAHDCTGGKRRDTASLLITLGGLRAMIPHGLMNRLIDDGIITKC